MDKLDAMRAFLLVAEKASFAEAARVLRWSPATTTRAVAMLEEELGLLLFHRTTRSVRITERGALYADRCRAILADVEAARSMVRGEDGRPRGLLSVTAPIMFGRLHILPVAEAVRRAHPSLVVRLTFVDRVTHLVEEGFDLAVRIGEMADSALIAWKAGETRRVVVASREYLARMGEPAVPADLRSHDIVSFEGVGSTNEWRFGHRGQTSVTVRPVLSVNSAEAALDAIERGHGIGRLLSYQVRQRVEAGALRLLLPAYGLDPVPISLVYQASRRTSPNIRAFMAEAKSYFAAASVVA